MTLKYTHMCVDAVEPHRASFKLFSCINIFFLASQLIVWKVLDCNVSVLHLLCKPISILSVRAVVFAYKRNHILAFWIHSTYQWFILLVVDKMWKWSPSISKVTMCQQSYHTKSNSVVASFSAKRAPWQLVSAFSKKNTEPLRFSKATLSLDTRRLSWRFSRGTSVKILQLQTWRIWRRPGLPSS